MGPIVELKFEDFPDRTLRIWLATDVQNSGAVHEAVVAGRLPQDAAIMNAEVTPSLFAVQLAAHRALTSQRQGRMRTQSLHAELICNISGSKHIAESLQRFGLTPASSHLLVASLEPGAELEATLQDLIQGHWEEHADKLPSLSDKHLLKKAGGGGGDWNPNNVVYGLLGANAAGFILWHANPEFMREHAVFSIAHLKQGRVWTLLTSSVSHRDTWHVLLNCAGVYFIGRSIGQQFGGKKLALVYAAGAVSGGLTQCAAQWWRAQRVPAWFRSRALESAPGGLGGSASLAALAALDIGVNPHARVYLYGVLPMPYWALGAAWVALDVTTWLQGGHGISQEAHFGGALAGAAFFLAYRRGRFPPRWYW